MRAIFICLFLNAMLFAGSASAYDANDPKNCHGAAWEDETRATVISKVTAKPRVHFVKSPYDDDFKAENCPAAGPACQKNSYLVTGDLVITGKRMGEFTCISYHSPLSTKRDWASGWLPSDALAPVAPLASPKLSDWIGIWRQGRRYVGGGHVEIKPEKGGKLHIDAGMLVLTARDFHNGAFEAHVTPQGDTIAFEDDGSNYGSGCKVRMQRIGPWLFIEDNSACGGAGVSFTGLYRREN
jgi:hypothetical protein